MKTLFCALCICTMLVTSCTPTDKKSLSKLKVEISVPDSLAQDIKDGRILFMLSDNNKKEPRFQIADGPDTQLVFGKNVEDWSKGQKIELDGSEFGYPIESMTEIPPGTYYVQALFHKYETFTKADGSILKLPMDRGEGQQWNLAPGNLYNTPIEIQIDSNAPSVIKIELNKTIPAVSVPEDTEYVKHIKIKSKLLSDFWGRDMYLGAHILLPKDWSKHPESRYPLAIFHGHFPDDFGGFRTTPPDTTIPCVYSDRFKLACYNRIMEQEAYDFYKIWTGPDFPRVLAIEIQHPTPFYDDSYAVNSANQGPYGDAITYELIPHIEKEFRGIGEGWARFTYGGSTGGWEALAVQLFYPEEYNGCYAACPDPIDFRAYTVVDIYNDNNAYYVDSRFKKTPRPGQRNYLGQVSATLKEMNYRELALGDKSRSGQQWDVWDATYSPVGNDGYPMPIWNKVTGEIDRKVADYWKENYDLAYIMKRDWQKNGQKWRGKIHLYCGDMDNYYLNNAVYLAEEILKETSDPHYDGEVDYGDRAEHCWNGDHSQPNAISRLRYHRMFIPKWTKEVKLRAPKGADLKSWIY
ncbi:MAG: hypothetical protein IPM42_16350 [Saprospiraceae bacterium]|nr:hypothetical protein [Saprospiraceae bacterium]